MTKQIKVFLIAVVGIIAINVSNASAQPTFGAPTDYQQKVNEAVASVPINIAGRQVTLSLEGDFWRGKLNGNDILAGECTVEETEDGSIITLQQQWAYVDSGRRVLGVAVASWVRTPGPQIVLEYKEGPPVTLLPKIGN